MDKNSPIMFSIITPVYNRADCVSRCIGSVLKQNFDAYELIVVNDGSTDPTLAKVEDFYAKVKNLNIITYPDNKGVNYARNRGIEQAKGEFIIFLDSDDQLTDNSLTLIEQQIKFNPGFKHYLFGVSDRITDCSIPKEKKQFIYKDWLSGAVSGDFAHVIKPECFDGLLFVEEFRIYESLNWLRVLRKNRTQLFIPVIVSERERERADSVTRETILANRESMRNNYNYLCQFINWYADDLKEYNLLYKLKENSQKALLLGIALKENDRNKELYSRIKNSTWKFKLINIFNRTAFSSVFFRLILLRSVINQIIRK